MSGFERGRRVTPGEWACRETGPVLGIDFETAYTGSYSVRQMGNFAYVHDRRFEAWGVSVSDGERTCVCRPEDFPWASVSGCELVAHHAEFDKAVFERLVDLGRIGWPAGTPLPSRWYCSAAVCAFLQLPRDLAGAAWAVFGVDVDKSPRKRAKGKARGPDLFGFSEEDAAYAATDAEMALALWRELSAHWPEHERRLFELTSAMGRHGLAIDWEYVEGCIGDLRGLVESLGGALPWSPALSLKGFEAACTAAGVEPPRSTAVHDTDFLRWIAEHSGSVAATWVRHMQRIRSANRTAKVLEGMRARRKADGRMAYELKNFGATTGRWSGGGGLNLQNLNRKEAEGVDLRRAIVAPPGKRLAAVDYSQIESRVLLYLAGDTASLEMFRSNPDADAYEIHARATMGWRPVSSEQGAVGRGDGEWEETLQAYCERTGSGLRQLAKARVLGLGFGCGAQRFVEVAKVMAGLELGESEADGIVKAFRETNPKIVRLWQRLNDACAACDGGDYVLPLPCTQQNPELGRYLIYRDVSAGRDGLECTVAGERVRVFGGLLAENWTQATARDVLASAWLRCEAAGYTPVLSVHDELVFEVDAGRAAAELAAIQSIMEAPVAWAPALPLKTDGKLMDRYGK